MVSPHNSWSTKSLTIVLLLLCITISSSVDANTSSSKLDQPHVSQPTYTEIKCGSCPCGSPCDDQLLPPPPPPPPPPSPLPLLLPEISSPQGCDLSPPPPPPPSRPPPSRSPPPPRFIYVTGVPGDAYPYYNYYSAAQNRVVGLLLLAGIGTLSITMLFGW